MEVVLCEACVVYINLHMCKLGAHRQQCFGSDKILICQSLMDRPESDQRKWGGVGDFSTARGDKNHSIYEWHLRYYPKTNLDSYDMLYLRSLQQACRKCISMRK